MQCRRVALFPFDHDDERKDDDGDDDGHDNDGEYTR